MESLRSGLAGLVSLSPLVVTLIVGVLLGVVEFGLFIGLPIVVFVVIYIVWITSNYFLEIAEFRALGNEGWPTFSLETLAGGRSQLGLICFALALAVAGGYAALRYSGRDTAAWIWLGAGLAYLPGAVALLAVTRQLFAALNPVRVLAAAAGMGPGYLYSLLGAAGFAVLLELAQARGGLWYFPLVYGVFLEAYLIGSVVYARRRALGVSTPRSPEARAERAQAGTVATRKSIVTHAYGFAAHGNKAGALRHVERYLAQDEDTLEARLWMLNETARWEDSDVALEFGKRVFDYCEQHGFAEEAARVRTKCDHLMAHRRTMSS